MSRPAVSRRDRGDNPGRRDRRAIGHYRVTPGAICRPMSEDYHQATGKNVKAAAAA